MTRKEITDEAMRLLNAPPIDLPADFDRLPKSDLQDIVSYLDALAGWAAFTARYIDARHGSGCGDQGHRDALRSANKARKQVRKALGYYITHDLSF